MLEGDFGLLPVEIKYGSAPPSRLRALDDFIRERNCRLGVVINNDAAARLYGEKIVGVPFACLMGR